MQKCLTKDETEMSIGTFQASGDEIGVQIFKVEWQNDEYKRENLLYHSGV